MNTKKNKNCKIDLNGKTRRNLTFILNVLKLLKQLKASDVKENFRTQSFNQQRDCCGVDKYVKNERI